MALSLKERLDYRRQRIFTPTRRQRFALETVHTFSREADQLLQSIFRETSEVHPLLKETSVAALGGYGRSELCPYSDIDLLVLHDGRGQEEAIESFVRRLWDLGVSIGCVVRTNQECAAILGDDRATDNAFLESEYIIGKPELYSSLLRTALRPYFRRTQQAYVSEICEELHGRIYSSANTLYRVEPDLKDGICTLRDCHRIVWAERVNGLVLSGKGRPNLKMLGKEEQDIFWSAYAYLTSLRLELHMLCGRRMDILDIGLQPDVAESMGLGKDGAGLLMERYFRAVTDVQRCILSFLEEAPTTGSFWQKARRRFSAFTVSPGLAVVDGILFLTEPEPPETESPALWLLQVFRHAITCHAVLSIGLRNAIRRMVEKLPPEEFRDEEVDSGFRAILSRRQQAGRILQLMHDTSFLEGIIPEFGVLRCRVEYDSYHEYTVDRHTLLAVCGMDDLNTEPDELIRHVYLELPRKELLRIALLLHDIGKALPGDHHRTGAVIAESVAERLGYSTEEIRRIRFLVYNHLAMSELSLHRVAEDELISDFAEQVRDQENLDMLYLLTVLDIRHVGSRTWTGWKAAQLRALYLSTSAFLAQKNRAPLPAPIERTDLIEGTGYVRRALPEELEEHERWLATLLPGELQFHTESLVGFSRLTVLAHDRKSFLSDLVGCFHAEGLCILHAQINSLDDGRILDVFNLECDDATTLPFERRLEGVRKRWQKITDGEAEVEKMIADRLRRYPPKPTRPSSRPPRISIDNSISPRYTVLEVEVPESAGLLHRIVSVLATNDASISSATISTLIDQARDVFYLTDSKGQKITCPETCEAIRTDLAALFGARPSAS